MNVPATRGDIKAVREEMATRGDIKAVREEMVELRAEISKVNHNLSLEITRMDARSDARQMRIEELFRDLRSWAHGIVENAVFKAEKADRGVTILSYRVDRLEKARRRRRPS